MRAIVDAHARDAGIIWGIGAHVIKTGVSPVIIDLMQRGYVSALAMNGAGVIHDFEIALAGVTSEDVDEALGPGRFGMAEETGRILNEVIRSAQSRQEGLGQAVGAYLSAAKRTMRRSQSDRDGTSPPIPVTVHVAIGTDIIHMHRTRRVRAIGDASLRDFRYFTSCVARLSGGVYLNCGSAVVLPEVFLKAVALARNQGIALDGLTTVNIDFMRISPADQRCDAPGGRQQREGNLLVGHHEVLIPLIAAAVIEAKTRRQA